MKETLKEALSSQKKLEGDLSQLKDKLVENSYQFFERENERISFLYPALDLSQMNLFKVVHDSQLVEEKEARPHNDSCKSLDRGTQTELGGNKVGEEKIPKEDFDRQKGVFSKERRVPEDGQRALYVVGT